MGLGVAVDGAGNALVTGHFTGSATFGAGEANETTLIAAGFEDIFIAQYAGLPIGGQQPDLLIEKRANPTPARVGRRLTYSPNVTNQGPGNATEVVVSDRLPRSVRLVSLPDNCQRVGRRAVRCGLSSLAAGDEVELDIQVRPWQRGSLLNRAWVKAAGEDLNPDDNRVWLKTRVN